MRPSDEEATVVMKMSCKKHEINSYGFGVLSSDSILIHMVGAGPGLRFHGNSYGLGARRLGHLDHLALIWADLGII